MKKAPSTEGPPGPASFSAWRTTLIISTTIMVTELAITLALSQPAMSKFSRIDLALLDAVLLGIVLSPVVYHLLMAPLRSQTIREQQQMYEMRDELTRLPSRKLFMELMAHEIQMAVRNGWTTTLIVADPARLSEINQIFGYAFGDRVLTEIASRFLGVLRQSDIVARISGDEFGLLLQRLDGPDVQKVVQKISAALDAPFLIDGIAVDIGVTMGIAIFPHHGNDTAQLLQRARVALSSAKNSLETYSMFEQGYESKAEDRIHLFGTIRRAIVQDEFELYFQPKVHMPTSRIVGAEALLRLNKVPSTPISRLIQFAEQTGIITDITRWVFSHAVAKLATWRREGLELNISVNLSARDILNDRLTAELLARCEENGVDPGHITLEITESAIMRQADKAIATLERLRELGFRISLDDFGTGYSSLSYLKRIPADELKIDQSFVRTIGEAGVDDTLIGLIVDIGDKLGMKIIAEGVETNSQSKRLLAMGCSTFQGYLISRPMPARELAAWHRDWTGTRR